MLQQLASAAAERHLFRATDDQVPLRSEPRSDAPQVGALEFGQVVLLRGGVGADGWARVHEDQVWALGLQAGGAGGAAVLPPVHVLVGGAAAGLPRHLAKEPGEPDEDWEFAEALRCAEVGGAPWRRLAGGLRPKSLRDLAWLSPWHSPDGTVLAAPPLLHDPHRFFEDPPVPKLCVASLVRGVQPRLLESLILQHFAAGFERVVLYFDAPEDPSEAPAIAMVKRFAQPRALGPGGLPCSAHPVLCGPEWWSEARAGSRYYQRREELHPVYGETARLDSEVRDVQARQMIAVEHALFEAQRDRFQWLLHVDADEVLYCPDRDRHSDARRFFAEVPDHFTCVRFANLEAVPEALEAKDPFQDVAVFKMNPALLQELGVEARVLPTGDVAPEDEEREEDLFDARHADAVPGHADPYRRLPRAERHALRRLLAVIREIAGRRSPVLDELGVRLEPQPRPPVGKDDDSDFSDDESCYWPRPDCPAYFNSYSNGKCAVRTRIGPEGELPPMPLGVHGFCRDGGQALYTLLCKGPGAPVVLHYANCGFSHWRKKYEILCRGHGTPDGAFSTTREGIAEIRSHLATRQLALRGSRKDLERFYRTFVLSNGFDELAYLAQFGLVVRLEEPRRLLAAARARLEESPLPPFVPFEAPPAGAAREGGMAAARAIGYTSVVAAAPYPAVAAASETAAALAHGRLGTDVARPRRHGE